MARGRQRRHAGPRAARAEASDPRREGRRRGRRCEVVHPGTAGQKRNDDQHRNQDHRGGQARLEGRRQGRQADRRLLRPRLAEAGNQGRRLGGRLQQQDDCRRSFREEAEAEKAGKQPFLAGTVKALSADGKSFTLALPKSQEGRRAGPDRHPDCENTKVVTGKEAGKLAVGQPVSVWLQEGPARVAQTVQIGKPAEKSVNKPGKQPFLAGTIQTLAADGKSFTLLPPRSKKGGEPAPIRLRIGERTRIATGKEPAKLAVGQNVTVWLEEGAADVAATVQVGAPAQPEKVKKLAPEDNEKKPEGSKKPREPAKPPRDPAPTAAVIDAEIERRLALDRIPASPRADDAEFLRRITLDLSGRIPSLRETTAFLDSTDPAKRRKLIDDLLDRPTYGEHFATIWRNLIEPRSTGGKGTANLFAPWLAEQFNDNRGWNAIVADLLNADGPINGNPSWPS